MRSFAAIAAAVRDRYDRVSSSAPRSALLAGVFTVVFFTVAAVAWVPNGVYDDWSISNALSGRWGDPQGLCLFVNAGLAGAIFNLNCMISGFNWFFIVERTSAFVAVFTIVYLSVRYCSIEFASIMTFGAFVLLVPGCTYESNFTYVAGACVCAGGLALLCSLACARHRACLLVVGWVLMVLGIAWRWTMFLLCIPIMGVAALMLLFGSRALTENKLGNVLRLWPFAIALVLFAGMYGLNASAWNEDPWSGWLEFNEIRSDISDYTYQSYDDFADELQAVGVSQNDYQMLKSWLTEDPEFFTAQRLADVRSVVVAKRSDPMRIVATFPSYCMNAATSLRFDVLFVALLVAIALCPGKKARRFALAIVLGTFVLCWALYAFGRLPARVELPVWMYAAACAGVLVGKNAPDTRGYGRIRDSVGALFLVLPVVAVAFILAIGIPHARPDRLSAIFDEESFTPSNYLTEYLAEHEEDLYALNVASNASIVYANLMIAPIDKGIMEHTTSLGGWAARAPYAVARNGRIDMPNPIKGLVDNPKALLVSAGTGTADMLKTYLREHYYPDADYEEVDCIADSKSSSKLFVYRFSKQ